MKRIIITIFFTLCAIASYAQAKQTINGFVYNSEGNPIAGATIKAVGDSAEAKSAQDGSFEMQAAQHCNFVEASCEGYISAQVELNGAIVLFRLKVDKKYAQMKAKEEAEAKAKAEAERRAAEEARIAAEQEAARIAAEKARAEEQARLAAEQEAARVAAEKAKAEEQARLAAEKEAQIKALMEQNLRLEAEKKTQAEQETARLAAEQEAARIAAERAKAEKQARLAVERKYKQQEKEARIAALGEIKSGYAQYVNLGYNIEWFWWNHYVQVQYIGGYRFNKNLFLGVGTGVNIATLRSIDGIYNSSEYTTVFTNEYRSAVSIPVFAHFRADFARRNRVNPFTALSVGGNLETTPAYKSSERKIYNHVLFGDLTIGINCRLNSKNDLYFGVTAGFGFCNGGLYYCYNENNQTLKDYYDNTSMFWLDELSLKFNVGISF